ncbi:MAG: glutamyl-tRNA reductase [Firmicutes bacterium]|nr:glutamyl-tRNA reductase [Bacillota bacterium]
MSVLVIGVNHKTAPVEVRELLSFAEHSLGQWYERLLDRAAVSGCVIVSTCNRTEIYAHTDDIEAGAGAILDMMQQKSGLDQATIKKYTYVLDRSKTVRHLFQVAAGLDSMLLGETQILGQVRTAYQHAHRHAATDKVINTLFKRAIEVGKRARTETGIDHHAVSISYAAVEMAKQIFGDLTGRSVLIIGAGKMSELTARHLVANGVSGVIVSNRSYERAVELAAQFGGLAVTFDNLYHYLEAADIVISCTAATHYVLYAAGVRRILKETPGKHLMLIDIAVPRDIEPDVRLLPGVSLYDIDALQNVVDNNLMERKRAAIQAEAIIEEEVLTFSRWENTQFVVPTITALKIKGEEIKQKELTKAYNRLGELSERERNIINTMAGAIINQLLHTPVTQLKEFALTEKGILYNQAISELFCLAASPGRQPEEITGADPEPESPAQSLGQR